MKTIKKQLLRYGTWNYGGKKFTIDKPFASQLVNNWKNHSPFAPVLRGHQNNNEAEKNPDLIIAKNIKDIDMDDSGVNVMFDADESELKKYNDVSASFTTSYEDHETGKDIGAMLEHVAMVVNPYIKGLGEFKTLSEQKDDRILIYLSEIMSDKKEDITLEDEVETPEEEQPEETPEVEETEEVAEEEAPEEETEVEDVVASESDREKLIKLEETVREQGVQLAEAQAEKQMQTLLAEGKILPKQKDAVLGLLMAEDQKVQLSDKSKTVGTLFSDFLNSMPSLVSLSETSTDDVELSELPAEFIKDLREQHKDKEDNEFEAYLSDNAQALRKSYAKHIDNS